MSFNIYKLGVANAPFFLITCERKKRERDIEKNTVYQTDGFHFYFMSVNKQCAAAQHFHNTLSHFGWNYDIFFTRKKNRI